MRHFFRFLPLLFASSLLFTACEKDDDDDDDDDITVDNSIFAEFVIGTDTIRYQDGVDGYGNGPGFNSYYDSHGTLHGQFTTFGRNYDEGDTARSVLSIQVVKFLEDTLPPSFSTEFLFFAPGSLGFGSYNTDSTNVGVSGAVIAYTDENGKDWSSDLLFGTQPSSSSFAISSHTAVDEPLYGARTRGTFHCTVFDGQGGSLELKGGAFHARTIFKQ